MRSPRTPRELLALVEPRKAVKRRNPVKQAETYARCFHSVERVEWVKAEPCAACGLVGYSENAHLLGNDGARRRGPYTEIGPLCKPHLSPRGTGAMVSCHRLYDRQRWIFDARWPEFNPEQVAAQTEERWLASGRSE